MEDKIEKLNKLGVEIHIVNPGNEPYSFDYKNLYLHSRLTDKEVENKLDERIKFVEERTWLNYFIK